MLTALEEALSATSDSSRNGDARPLIVNNPPMPEDPDEAWGIILGIEERIPAGLLYELRS